jgi:hypothetical protein
MSIAGTYLGMRPLRKISEYNNVSQTAILLEALELHLPSFPQPPAEWERKWAGQGREGQGSA